MRTETVHTTMGPIELRIQNLVAQGGSNFRFDLSVYPSSMSSMAIVNPTTWQHYLEHNFVNPGMFHLRGIRVSTARPKFIFGSVGLRQKATAEPADAIVAELDFSTRRPRIMHPTGAVILR